MTVRAADRTGLGLALIPEAHIKTGDSRRRRKIFGQGDLDHTRTSSNLGQTGVGLHHTRVDHTKSTQVNYEAIIGNLHRQVTNVHQPSTGVNWGDAQRSTTEADTTCESSITLGGFLVGHPNNTISHELDSTDIGHVQGLDQLM